MCHLYFRLFSRRERLKTFSRFWHRKRLPLGTEKRRPWNWSRKRNPKLLIRTRWVGLHWALHATSKRLDSSRNCLLLHFMLGQNRQVALQITTLIIRTDLSRRPISSAPLLRNFHVLEQSYFCVFFSNAISLFVVSFSEQSWSAISLLSGVGGRCWSNVAKCTPTSELGLIIQITYHLSKWSKSFIPTEQ